MRRTLLRLLRAARLIGLADRVFAWRAAHKLRHVNEAYRREHPEFTFPDPMLVFEVAGHASLEAFDRSGARHAQMVTSLLRDARLPASPRVLEWGCGPARVLRHLQAALNDGGARLHGCDPDPRALAFAREANPAIAFQSIAPTPPTAYESSTFDAIYGISIFTHLGEVRAGAWAAELARLSKATGCVLVTNHGALAAARLNGARRRDFDAGQYVALGGASEGSRTYVSYFNEAAGRRLFDPFFDDIAFRAAASEEFGQDIWLLRRPRHA
jgi:SAM-dependent methyltransferase